MSAPEPDPMRSMERYLSRRPRDEYLLTHRLRYLETWRRLHPLLPGVRDVMELGALSAVGAYLRDVAGLQVRTVETDLRRSFPMADGCADLVLCLEVLEHVSDLHGPGATIGEVAMFTGSGVRNLLREARRVLRPGGRLVLTTPNATSIDVVGNVLRRRHPFLYPPHVREHAPADVLALAEAAGLRCEDWTTFFAWNAHPDVDRGTLTAALAGLGFDMAGRGDDAFFVFAPAAPA